MVSIIDSEETFLKYQALLDKGSHICFYPMSCVEESNNYFCLIRRDGRFVKRVLVGRNTLIKVETTKMKYDALRIRGVFLKGRILTLGQYVHY